MAPNYHHLLPESLCESYFTKEFNTGLVTAAKNLPTPALTDLCCRDALSMTISYQLLNSKFFNMKQLEAIKFH